MIVSDYECMFCHEVQEHYWTREKPKYLVCPVCGQMMKPIITMRQTTPIDADWLASVLEVVDKNPLKPHCQEFIKHPTRANYRKWMKAEKLRPIDRGEQPVNRKIDKKKQKAEMKETLNRCMHEACKIEI